MSEQEDDTVGEVFGWIGAVFSILFMAAPVIPYLKLIKSELTTKEVPGILLICSFTNCYLWLIYGLWEKKEQVYLNAAVGGSLTLVWIIIFIIYSTGRRFFISLGFMALLMIVVFGFGVFFYFVVDPEVTGVIAMVVNVLNFAAPGEKIYTVTKTGNYELIPIFSTIGAFLCSACWLVYGSYMLDLNIAISNLLGLIFAVLQAVIYFIYKKKAAASQVKGKLKEGNKNQSEDSDVDP